MCVLELFLTLVLSHVLSHVYRRFVTKELISRGFNVTAFAREKAGIKGKMSKDDTTKVGQQQQEHQHAKRQQHTEQQQQ